MKDDPVIYPRKAQERDIDALSNMGVIYYSISGGEPTLVKDLPERLAYACTKLPYVHLVTNGSTMTVDLAKRLGATGIQEISVSLDGLEEFHNQMRGVTNAFKKGWNAIHLLRTHAPKVDVVINSILTPYNLNSLRELKQKLEETFPGIYSKYLPLTYHELFLNANKNSFFLEGNEASSCEEIKEFIDAAILDPNVVNSTHFLRRAKSFFNGSKDVLSEQKKCTYPYYSIQFDSYGHPTPCLTGCPTNNNPTKGTDLTTYVQSHSFRMLQKELESCEKCRGSMMLCYYEPRLNFPLHQLILSSLNGK
jgi:MoaA/NifB/PqqE/SkfB family radical SAM enzyme